MEYDSIIRVSCKNGVIIYLLDPNWRRWQRKGRAVGPVNLLFNVQGANRLAVDRSDRNGQDWSRRIRIGHASPFRMIKGCRFESANRLWKKVLLASRYILFHLSSSPLKHPPPPPHLPRLYPGSETKSGCGLKFLHREVSSADVSDCIRRVNESWYILSNPGTSWFRHAIQTRKKPVHPG
jgi:hypothetical protein